MVNLGKNAFDNPARCFELGSQTCRWLGDLIVTGTITSEGSGGEVLPNNAWLQWRNAADTANLDVLQVDDSDNTVLKADTSKQIIFAVGGVFPFVVTTLAVFPGTNGGTDLGKSNAGFGTIYAALTHTLTVKAGTNGKAGTFVANGVTPVTVATTGFLAGSVVAISLKTVGGTVGAIPHLATATAGTGFTVVGTALDTSTYNWVIIDTN